MFEGVADNLIKNEKLNYYIAGLLVIDTGAKKWWLLLLVQNTLSYTSDPLEPAKANSKTSTNILQLINIHILNLKSSMLKFCVKRP